MYYRPTDSLYVKNIIFYSITNAPDHIDINVKKHLTITLQISQVIICTIMELITADTSTREYQTRSASKPAPLYKKATHRVLILLDNIMWIFIT